jgi:hypothetical protein
MKKDTQQIMAELKASLTELEALSHPPKNVPPLPDFIAMERERHEAALAPRENSDRNRNSRSRSYKKWLLVMSAPAVAVAIVLFVFLPAADMHLVSQAGGSRVERGFDPTTLPQEMNLNLKKLRLTLASEGDRLEGTLTPVPGESTPEEEVFQVVLTGLDRDKVKGSFSGRIRIVRKATAAPIKTKQDIGKVIVEGDFRVGDQAAQPVSRAYQP